MDWDFVLIQRMRTGNDDAVETFVRKYYPVILKYCRYHTRNKENAEDLTQETFARFFAALPGYQHRGKTANYLYVIAGNLCRDSWRGPEELPLVPQETPPGVWADSHRSQAAGILPETPMEAAEERLVVEQALARLPEELREVVILHFFQNLKLREISEILQVGLPLVKYRMRRAKELLKTYLGEEESR